MRLTRVEGNVIYRAIEESVVSISDCSVEMATDRYVKVTHSSGSVFSITAENAGYAALEVVRDGNELLEARRHQSVVSIAGFVDPILGWARRVRDFVETPDLWKQFESSQSLLIEIQQEDADNTPFTQDEQRQIVGQLNAIRKEIAEKFELSAVQLGQLDEGLKRVEEAGQHMGRKDWLIYFLGSITALIMTAPVTGGIGEPIITMFVAVLGHLFIGGSEPPQIIT